MLMMTGEEGGEEDEVEAAPPLPLPPPLSAALLSAGKAALLVENVPTASMSSTVLNPLAESASAAARKLPAAQFTSTSSAPPEFDVATETHRSTSSGFLTSPWIPWTCARTPQESRSATAASRTAWRRPVTKTEAPWRPRTKEDEFFVEVERLRISMAWLSSLFFISPSLSRPSYQTASQSRGRYPRSLP